MKARNRNKVARAARVKLAQDQLAKKIQFYEKLASYKGMDPLFVASKETADQTLPGLMTSATELQRAEKRGRSRSHSKRVKAAVAQGIEIKSTGQSTIEETLAYVRGLAA